MTPRPPYTPPHPLGDWNPDTDPHTVQLECGLMLTYWRGRDAALSACGRKQADIVEVYMSGHPHYPQFRYPITGGEWPSELQQLIRVLQYAYRHGQNNWAARMQDILRGPGK